MTVWEGGCASGEIVCAMSWRKKLYLSPIQLSHVFGPIGHVVLQGGPKMSDAKPVFLISPIVLQPAIVPVSSQRREVRSNM